MFSTHCLPAASLGHLDYLYKHKLKECKFFCRYQHHNSTQIHHHIRNYHFLYLNHHFQISIWTLPQPVTVLQDIPTIQMASSNQR